MSNHPAYNKINAINFNTMTNKDLRTKFIGFFTSSPRNHKEIPSAPLVPENDPTVLFITAGMHPLVPYLMGESHPLGKRLVDIQKSIRTDDIEEVGDLSHLTFFEMLGNWSLGDYFKREAINWSFEFLTDKQWLGMDPARIYVSVFAGDQDAPVDNESIFIWKEVFDKKGIEAGVGNSEKGIINNARIFPYPKSKNWWGPAGLTGPCGPDTEMFYDTRLPLHNDKLHGRLCHINCNCGRFLEIWNDVFMQYNKTSDGKYISLTQKNVDTGMGMERMVSVLSWLNKEIPEPDPFLTQLFKDIIITLETLSGKKYHENYKKLMRIIADHVRAAVFIVSDGVVPGNKERGYVLRKLIRRAVRYGQLLEIKDSFLSLLTDEVVSIYKDSYPQLEKNKTNIRNDICHEENKFRTTLDRGLKEINKYNILTGKTAFDLYQSFGFPLELTIEIAKEKGQSIDKASFEKEFEKHQDLSRTAAKGTFKGGLQDHSEITTKLHTATHLLQQALRQILGDQVRQKGSNITADRLRFDYSYSEKVSPPLLQQIEDLVNQKIAENLPVRVEIKLIREAVRDGALTVPEAKYPEKVKVYSVGNFSQEVCGGPHIDFTGKLGKFKIVKEEAKEAGVRRIYATLEYNNVNSAKNSSEERNG